MLPLACPGLDIRGDRSVCHPRRMKVRQWPAQVEAGAALADGLAADTFPVSFEDAYVVVEA